MAIHFYSDIHLNANKLGRDADNLLDFSTDNEITFRVGAGDGVVFKASGEIEATSLDISGSADIDGTMEADVVTIDGTNVLTGGIITTLGTISQDTVTFTSANADDPNVIIQNTTNDAQGARLTFKKHRGVDAVDGDNLGEIEFWGYDDGTPSEQIYGKIITEIHDATSGQESGQMNFVVASHDGGQNTGLKLTGGSVDNEVDVEIGRGAASVTAVQGDLTVAGSYNLASGDIPNNAANTTGSAATLTTARTIGGVSFDGSANITLPGVNAEGNQNTTGNAATASKAAQIIVNDNESTAEENQITFIAGAAGGSVSTHRDLEADGDLTYNPSTGTLTATLFNGKNKFAPTGSNTAGTVSGGDVVYFGG